MFFDISSSIHFLLRCASAGSSLVLQSSLVSKFSRSDHSCRGARNFFIRDLNTWEVEVFFDISSSIHFLLRCASAGSSLVLQSSLVSKFSRSDH